MKTDRMMIYCWEELMFPGEFKIGEHWVNNLTLDDAINDTIIGRIRGSLGVRKDHFDRGDRIKVHFVLDASAYAKQKNKFSPNSKLDAELHQLIEGRYGRGEVFECELEHIHNVVEKEIGTVNTVPIESKINSKKFKELIRIKDKNECILTQGDNVDIWKRIIANIPERNFYNKRNKFLIVACGYGTEITVLIEKLMVAGWTDSEIKKSIIINDKSDQFTKPWEALGYKVVVGDFLYLRFGMKFDIIIGNPPYQDSSTGNGSKLYPKFFTKCFDELLVENGILGFITPTAWLAHFNSDNDKSRNKEMDRMKQVMREYFISYIDFTATKEYFKDVGSTFSSYILRKTTDKKPTLVADTGERIIIPYLLSLPKDFTTEVFSIFEKTSGLESLPLIEGGSYSNLGFHSSPVDKNKKRPVKNKSAAHAFPLLHTNVQTLYSDTIHPLQHHTKVVASLSGHFKPFYDAGTLGLTEHGVAILVENESHGSSIIRLLESKLYKFLLYQTKHNGFTNQYALRKMPFIALSEYCTDMDIYKRFNLSDTEIALIEASV